MKDYINLFHSMVSEIHFWDDLSKSDKIEKLSIFLEDFNNIDDLLDYFDEFNLNLSKKTLNYYLKSVSSHNYGQTKTNPSRTGMRRAQTMKFSTKNIVEDKKSGEYRLYP